MSDRSERQNIIKYLDKNLLVTASAGSGKTAMLVERLVAMVENSDIDLSKVVTITFTKKAAGEFYDRFYKKLQLRTKPGFDFNKDDKYSYLGNPSPEAIERDKKALKEIDTCFFGTIDAFYQKILNEHPFEAGLSSSAKIIDDDEFKNYLLRKFSSYLKSDKQEIREGAIFFSELIGVEGFYDLMSPLIENKDLKIYQLPQTLSEYEHNFDALIDDFIKGVDIIARNRVYFQKSTAADQIEKFDTLTSSITQLPYLKRQDLKNARRLISKFCGLKLNEDTSKLLPVSFKKFVSKEVTTRSTSYKINDIMINAVYDLVYFKTYDFLISVRDDLYNNLVKDGSLTFSIASDYLLKMLRKESEYKITIESIRDSINNILLDECQDTDAKQYEIFFRLLADDFAPNYEDLHIKGGKFYICGDRKQSIYHFRGANVDIFDGIQKLFDKKKNSGEDYEIINLTDNFRSKEKPKLYFNEIFTKPFESEYSPISNIDSKKITLDEGVFGYITNKNADPEKVANIILDLVNNRGYKFRDFMVITNGKLNINAYSKIFSVKGIPCYCEGYIDICVSELLNTIISLFKYIGSKKQDKIAYLEVLNSHLFNFDLNNIKKTFKDDDFLSKLSIDIDIEKFPSELLEKLVSQKQIIQKLNCNGIDVLFGFIHLLKEKENNGEVQNYSEAITYFEDLQNGDSVVERLSLLSNSINAVQIANIHKTKGLEKSVVILTAAGGSKNHPKSCKDKIYYYPIYFKEKDRFILFKNTQADTIQAYKEETNYASGEDLRLLYVAATRAGKRLYIAIPESRGNKWGGLINNTVIQIDPQPQTNDIKSVPYNGNARKVEIDNTKSFEIKTPSKLQAQTIYDENYEPTSSSRDEALIAGTMIHKLLEVIIKSKDILLNDSVCDYIAASYARSDLSSLLKEVKRKFCNGGFKQKHHIFNNDDLFSFAKQCDCLTEVPFSFKEGNDIISGFIDLVLVNGNQVIIVDYKTDSVEEDHTSQLSCYEKALKCNPYFKDKEIESCIYHIDK